MKHGNQQEYKFNSYTSTVEAEFNIIAKFLEVYLHKKLIVLLLLRNINQNITIKDLSIIQRPRPIKQNQKLIKVLQEKIKDKLDSGRLIELNNSV